MWTVDDRWRTRWPREGQADVRRKRGRHGEQMAREWLEREGFVIEASNVRFRVGEIDLVAREGTTLCFIEVRARTSFAYGGALASIDDRKRRRLVRAAQVYLNGRGVQPESARFDVVAIDRHGDGPPMVELVRGAFDATS